jgi:hypothetical protein
MQDVLGDFDLARDPENSESRDDLSVVSSEMSQLAVAAGFLLRLDRETLIASNGEELTLSGWIEVTSPDAAVEEFQLCLRDPQTQRVLVNDRHPLVGQTYSFPFFLNVTLPANLDTRLIQGELRLWGVPFGADLAIVLANQAFTITVNPTALVRELDQVHASLSEQLLEAAPLLELSFLEREPAAVEVRRSLPIALPKREIHPLIATQSLTTARQQSLPPQLQSTIATKSIRRPLDLPMFGNGLDEPQVDGVASMNSLPAPEELAEATTPSSDSAVAPVNTAEELSPQVVLEEPVAGSPVPIAPSSPEAALVAPCPMESAFRSLNLQARFLDRLTLLAADSELPALLRGQSAKPRDFLSRSGQHTPPLAPASVRLGEEIVINDEPIDVKPSRRRDRRLAVDRDSTRDQSQPPVLHEEEPVPIPELQVTPGELVAGQLVNIRVRLPDGRSRIYVKLWINDCQTRTLMDGPRWLVDFLPNGHGALEALTQLTVPYGSLEIRFEAIAIEMQTQRESRKTSVDRAVVPPDLPALSLYEFEV